MEEYFQWKDLYTTLVMTFAKPRGIISTLWHTFQPPLPPRMVWLLRHTFLLPEADNVRDYRSQILFTFGPRAENGFHQKSMYFIMLHHTHFVFKSLNKQADLA